MEFKVTAFDIDAKLVHRETSFWDCCRFPIHDIIVDRIFSGLRILLFKKLIFSLAEREGKLTLPFPSITLSVPFPPLQ